MTIERALTPEINCRAAMGVLTRAFAEAGVPDAGYDARLLLCAAADIDHAALIRDPETPLDDTCRARLLEFATRRLAREPVTRILGTRGFWSFELDVAPDVLDPRPDSETLVDAALDVFGDRQSEALTIADLGSGSGALLCALLDVFPNASGVAVDLSVAACALTARNLARCGFANRGRTVQGDWSRIETCAFDLVVSNPPYIGSDEIAALDPEVRLHDPRLALDGGPDGLSAYRDLASVLPGLLRPEGVAILEIGAGQGPAVVKTMEAAGLSLVSGRRDLGGIERGLIFRIATREATGRRENFPTKSLGSEGKSD